MWGGEEEEFRAILKISSQDTIHSSLDLCMIFFAVKQSTNLEKWLFYSEKNHWVANSDK